MGSDATSAPSEITETVSPAGLWIRRIATVALLAALVSPALRNSDSLPLSTYPMYSSTRSNLSSFATASGVDEAGDRTTLSALIISESRDRLIAQAFLNDTVQRGEAAQACAEIATRVDAARVNTPVFRIEIAIEQHDTIARLRGEDSLRHRDLVTSCEVGP